MGCLTVALQLHFPNWSNNEYYSSLELSLTHAWESTKAGMVLALSIAISISTAATALLTCMHKSQQFLVYIDGDKFSFAEVNCSWVVLLSHNRCVAPDARGSMYSSQQRQSHRFLVPGEQQTLSLLPELQKGHTTAFCDGFISRWLKRKSNDSDCVGLPELLRMQKICSTWLKKNKNYLQAEKSEGCRRQAVHLVDQVIILHQAQLCPSY